MDALLMCGGRGTRLDADVEKPLLEVGGRPMIDRVREALAASRVGTVHAVGSPHVPRTLAHVTGPTIEAPGAGYVQDLQYALERVDPPVLSVTADIPLLAPEVVDDVLAAYDGGSVTVCVPAALKRQLGVTVDATVPPPEAGEAVACTWTDHLRDRELAPTGLNVVGAGDRETARVSHDARLAVNVNRRADAGVAEALLGDAR